MLGRYILRKVLAVVFVVLAVFALAACGGDPGNTSAASYTVTFDKNGGDTEASPATKTVAYPATTVGTLPTPPARAGYGFAGWATEAAGGTAFTASTKVTANITVYAQWGEPCTVTFDKNGGDTEANPAEKIVAIGTAAGTLPAPPTRAGCTFTGWRTAASGGDAFTSSTKVTANITVYAQWMCTVTFDKNGGDTEADPAIKTIVLPATTVGTLPTPPARAGCTFTGWRTAGGMEFTASTTVTASITVYAQWVLENIASHIMVPIESGTFLMGGSYSVTLTKDFYMGKYEVTQELYQTVMGSNPSSFKTSPEHPAENMNWYSMIVFCNKLSVLEELTPVYSIGNGVGGAGSTNTADWGSVPTSNNPAWNAVTVDWDANGYRLPTEAEWEYACRAGSTTRYNLGDTWSDAWGWYNGNSGGETHEVGLKTPNAWGLCDMHGNVWEWCWDRHGLLSVGTDPTGPASGSTRVIRGGGWDYGVEGLRSDNREGYSVPDGRYYALGFRVVRNQD
jgi:uncharacterized repeat protein (TIGR02543 family)